MRVLRCSAAYERYVVDRVRQLLTDIERDAAMRADDDPRIRQFASVPSAFLDRRRTGTLAIVVGIEDPAQTKLELEPRAEKSS